MCDKCVMTGRMGDCTNKKASCYNQECPAMKGMSVHDCPYAIIKTKNCDTCTMDCPE